MCGGTGWVEVRTRGMCGCDSEFEEVERTPCELCAAHLGNGSGRDIHIEVAERRS